MKKRTSLLQTAAALLLLSSTACNRNQSDLTLQQVDALVNVLPGQTEYPLPDDTLRAACGENVVAQFILSSPSGKLEKAAASLVSLKGENGDLSTADAQTGWVKNVRSSHSYFPPAPDSLQSSNGEYPDPIITDTTISLLTGEQATLWVDFPIPTDAAPGIYKGVIGVSGEIDGKPAYKEENFILQVYPVTLPEQSLLVTNWYFPVKFPFLNNGDTVIYDSDLYWDCMKNLVEIAGKNGQNVWLVGEVGTPVPSTDGKNMSFDFSAFDKKIEFLLENAPVKLIEADHFGKRSQNKWTDPFWANVAVLDGKGGYTYQRLAHTDPRVKKYIDSYFPALQEHLASKPLNDGTDRTWLDIYTQHVADEPLIENIESWEALAAMVKTAAPKIRIIEAYRCEEFKPELIDIIVPQLDELAWEHYRTMPEGVECWFYTCMYPRANFANRYVTLPLIKTRLLHWINFKYNSPGYLHWGFNFWGEAPDPYGDVSVAANDWPGGDSHIVYPGYRKIYPSIRLAAMRDGIRDYDLLKMVAAKDSAKAQEFVNAFVQDFDKYDTSIAHFRKARKEMLEYLSK